MTAMPVSPIPSHPYPAAATHPAPPRMRAGAGADPHRTTETKLLPWTLQPRLARDRGRRAAVLAKNDVQGFRLAEKHLSSRRTPDECEVPRTHRPQTARLRLIRYREAEH